MQNMTKNNIYDSLVEKRKKGEKQFAFLIDPDKQDIDGLKRSVELGNQANIDYFFVGGSLLTTDSLDNCVKTIKGNSDKPVVLFPGNTLQISYAADAILFLSLISGRNPELLIGRHVITAPYLKLSSLEIISTGYMLIESGDHTTVSYMSNTTPIPSNKNDVALCTALAGEMLGLKLIFMDGGSGATHPISESMISKVSETIDIPLIIGGGISTPEKAYKNCKAGADVIVVGNAIEKDPGLIKEISAAIRV